jgi:hypothetical protein
LIFFFQNSEFSHHFKEELLHIYSRSWIGKYYGYVGHCLINNVVVFYSKKHKLAIFDNSRFHVNVWFFDLKSQLYFYPPGIWEKIGPSIEPDFTAFKVESLSHLPHGMITNGYPYAKSPFYKSPFFLTFKTGQTVNSNFLIFNDFLIPNSYGQILSLLTFDDDTDKFVPEYKSDLVLPFSDSLSLTNVLEFRVYDADKTQIEFMDLSQLYICIEVL